MLIINNIEDFSYYGKSNYKYYYSSYLTYHFAARTVRPYIQRITLFVDIDPILN